MMYDETNMRFWRTGRLEIAPSVAEQERKHIEEAEAERLTSYLDIIIQHKMADETLQREQYDLALALYLECRRLSIGVGTPAWHRRQRVLRAFEHEFLLEYPSK